MKKKGGRPTKYTQDLADLICEGISNGSSLRTVCKEDGMPAMSAIFNWIRTHKEFEEQYARACTERSEAMHEEILDIADDGTNDWMEINGYDRVNNEAIQRSKLRVETRKWLMSKMIPKKYGDKLELDATITTPAPLYGGKAD